MHVRVTQALMFLSFAGVDCSIPDTKGVWYEVEASHLPIGRASHKSAVDDAYMYVVKGETFGAKSSKVAR